MKITYDSAKNAANIAKHGVSFERVMDFRFDMANEKIDARRNYGETRYIATSYLGSRLYVLCYKIAPGGIRAISFRKANERERKNYEKEKGQKA